MNARRRGVLGVTSVMIVLAAAVATAAAAGSGHSTSPAAHVTAEPHPLVIAHRGYSAIAPEDTVPAMMAATNAHVDMVEIDVQRTRDHALVVIHDKTFARTTDIARVFPRRVNDPIGSFTLREVRRLDAGSWKGAQFAGTSVPTLDELLGAVQPTTAGVLLELKNPALYPGYEKQVADSLRRHGFVAGRRASVNSFSTDALRVFHAAAPSVPVGLIDKTGIGTRAHERWLQTVSPAAGAVTDARVDRAEARHLLVLAWPGAPGRDNTRTFARLLADGVGGIITNHPDLARRMITAPSTGLEA